MAIVVVLLSACGLLRVRWRRRLVMVSAEQSMQITRCGSPIWGWERAAQHGQKLYPARFWKGLRTLVLSLLDLLSLEVPGLQCDTAGTGYHSSSFPGQRLSTEPPSAFRSPRVMEWLCRMLPSGVIICPPQWGGGWLCVCNTSCCQPFLTYGGKLITSSFVHHYLLYQPPRARCGCVLYYVEVSRA